MNNSGSKMNDFAETDEQENKCSENDLENTWNVTRNCMRLTKNRYLDFYFK